MLVIIITEYRFGNSNGNALRGMEGKGVGHGRKWVFQIPLSPHILLMLGSILCNYPTHFVL